MVQGRDGNFYGTTYQGGSNNQGASSRSLLPGVFTIIHSFVYKSPSFDGQLPWAGLTLGPDGNFYGTTANGGSKNDGTLFKVTPSGTETVLYNFCDPTCNGYFPATPMVLGTDGNFYGNTSGNSNGGAVFYRLSMNFSPLVNLVTWEGKVGQTVQILGQGFTGTTKVLFGSTPATFNNSSDTYMTATVPAGATTGTVTVTTFTSTYKSNRSFLVIPQITSFSPASVTVGSLLTINGVSLSQTSKVTVGGKNATFTIKSDSQVTATVPAGAKTGMKVTITTAGGVANSVAALPILPSISSFSPSQRSGWNVGRDQGQHFHRHNQSDVRWSRRNQLPGNQRHRGGCACAVRGRDWQDHDYDECRHGNELDQLHGHSIGITQLAKATNKHGRPFPWEWAAMLR